MRKTLWSAALLVATLIFPLVGSTSAQADPAPTCDDQHGVTVAVSYTPDASNLDVRCVAEGNVTALAAFQQAGFAIPAADFVTTIDNVDPSKEYGSTGWWALFISTSDGKASGPASTDWVPSEVGAGDGPTLAGQAYLFCARDTSDWPPQPCGTTVAEIRAKVAVQASPTPSASPSATPSTTHGASNLTWIVAGVVLVVIVAAIIIVVARRRRTDQ